MIVKFVKNPFIFCSFLFSLCACMYKNNFSIEAFILYFVCSFFGAIIPICFYDALFNENLKNRIFQEYTTRDLKHILKDCNIEICKDQFGGSHFLIDEDKNKILKIIENTENLFNKKEP